MKEENQAIIKALNMYGRVPEQWELLNEIERLNNIIKQYDKVSFIHEMELQKRIDKAIEYIEEKVPQSLCLPNGVYDMREIDKTELLNILRGENDE